MAAVDVVDEDTLEAVRALWLKDPTGLPSVFKQPVQTGRLKTPQPMPYCAAACEQGPRANERLITPNQVPHRFDYRKVAFTVRGLKPDVVKGMAAVQGWFGAFLGLPDKQLLEFPSKSKFIRMMPLGDGKLDQDPDTKEGDDIWRGTIEYEVWTVRTDT